MSGWTTGKKADWRALEVTKIYLLTQMLPGYNSQITPQAHECALWSVILLKPWKEVSREQTTAQVETSPNCNTHQRLTTPIS